MRTFFPSPPLPPDAHGVRRVEFKALGTNCALLFRQPSDQIALQFVAEALGWIQAFEAKFSRFKPDSMVSQINAAAGKSWVETDAEMDQLLDLAEAMYRLTNGILDPAMLPLLRVWDWKKARESLPAKTDVEKARDLSRWQDVQRRPGGVFLPRVGMGLDFGGFGKEHAVDQVIAIAKRHGILDILVDLGRDIFALGGNGQHPFWHVGIQDGVRPENCLGGLAVSGYAVCASGDYARRFEHEGERYGHILDPRTGWPVRHGLRAVTVLASSCVVAGIYATSIFVLGWREGMVFAETAPGVEACLQNEQGQIATSNFIQHQVRGTP